MNDAEIGVNVPPLHPFCRSVIIPAYENEARASRTRWARNPITGKGMKVPADMSYDEWYKTYVTGNGLKHNELFSEQIVEKTVANQENSVIIKSNNSKGYLVVKPKDKQISLNGSSKFSNEAKQNLLEYEESYNSRKTEYARIYYENGKVAFDKTIGEEKRVKFETNEIKSMKNCVLSHNHSNGTTFTSEDINILRKSKLSEIRASVNNGAYVMRQPKSWSDISGLKDIENLLYGFENEYAGKNYIKVINKEISFLEFDVSSQQYAVERLCKKYKIEYFFEERKI